MANIISQLTKDDPKKKHPAPWRDEETIYVGRYQRGILVHDGEEQGERQVPVSINGHAPKFFTMGKETTAPEEYIQVLENSQSTIRVIDSEKYDPERGGVPRRQRDFKKPEYKTESLGDYELYRRGKKGD